MATRVPVQLPQLDHQYTIAIGSGLLPQLGSMLTAVDPSIRRVLLVTQEALANLYMDTVMNALQTSRLSVNLHVMPDGEANKTMECALSICHTAQQAKLTRSDAILALGGGIVGDVSGLAASLYRRGIPFIQVPTTLLAQVDSSVGGKVAVNAGQLKNLLGAFYQPHAVFIDTDTLRSLPPRELLAGLAEVMKYAFIEGSINALDPAKPPVSVRSLFEACPVGDYKALITPELIAACCELKARVVIADPNETRGIREWLNLGHTFAHAYETLSDHEVLHGEAVGIGLEDAFALALKLNHITEETYQQAIDLIRQWLPTQQWRARLDSKEPSFSNDDLLAVMAQDKKRQSADEGMPFILPTGQPGIVKRFLVEPAQLSHLT